MTSYVEFYYTTNFNAYDELFAWLSNTDEIDWMVLVVKHPPNFHAGNLVLFKGIDYFVYYILYHCIRFSAFLFDFLFEGMLFHFNVPNKDSSFGFHITLHNSSIEFDDIKTYGDQLYPKGQKDK